MAEDSQEQANAEDQGVGEPEDPDVCAGCGIRADFAVVDTCGSTVGQNAGYAGAISGGAVRIVVERGADRDDDFVCSPGNAGQVDGKWKDVVADQLGSAGDCVDADPGGLVVELRCSSNQTNPKEYMRSNAHQFGVGCAAGASLKASSYTGLFGSDDGFGLGEFGAIGVGGFAVF